MDPGRNIDHAKSTPGFDRDKRTVFKDFIFSLPQDLTGIKGQFSKISFSVYPRI